MRNQYRLWENTPLKFYKFLCAMLPITCVLGVFGSIALLIQYQDIPAYYITVYFWLDMLFRILLLGSLFTATYHLPRRNWLGVVCLLLYMAVFCLYEMISNLISGADFVYSSIVNTTVSVGMLLPVCIYFKKRRLLFFPEPVQYQDFPSPVSENEEKKCYAQQCVDAFYTELFVGQVSPHTGLPIKSEQDYLAYQSDCDKVTGKTVPPVTPEELARDEQIELAKLNVMTKEVYAQHRVDLTCAKLFSGKLNPFTQTPILSEADYRAYQKAVSPQISGQDPTSLPAEPSTPKESPSDTTKKQKTIFPVSTLKYVVFILLLVAAIATTIYYMQSNARLQTELTTTQESLSQMEYDYDRVQNQYNAILRNNKQLYAEKVAMNDELLILRVKSDFMDDHIVFVTPEGRKYHMFRCQYFYNARSYYAFNVENAIAQGYRPCLVCRPPE